MTALSEALTAYRICAQAEGRSPRTLEWVEKAVGLFRAFLGGDPDISTIDADDLRQFIVAQQRTPSMPNIPF